MPRRGFMRTTALGLFDGSLYTFAEAEDDSAAL